MTKFKNKYSTALIKKWISLYQQEHGKNPLVRWNVAICYYMQEDGFIPVKWSAIDTALRRGSNGLPGNQKLSDLTNSKNKRIGVKYKAFGEEKSITQWAKDSRCQVNHRVLRARIQEYGWDIELAITTTSKKGRTSISGSSNIKATSTKIINAKTGGK